MASRTTPTAVVDQLQNNYDSVKKPPLTRPMKQAEMMVNNLVLCAGKKGVILDPDLLEVIECTLACHYYQRSDKGFQAKTTGRASGQFEGQTTQRLSSTLYGQDALSLDYTGCLSSFDKGGRVSLTWLGKPKSDQIDYVDRD